MIKVLHVLSDSNIGGAGTYVATCLEYCDKTKVEQTVLLPTNSNAARIMKKSGAKIIFADFTPDKSLDLKAIPLMRKIIQQGKYDIVHTHGCVSARIAATGLSKTVFTKHTLSDAGYGIKGLINKAAYRAVGGFAIAVSDAAFSNLVELGFNRKKIYTVKNGVGDIGIANCDKKAKAKASFGIDTTKTVVGCVARFSAEKDYETLLFAAKKICDANDKIAFLLCGEGPLLNDMKSLAKKLGIYSKCVFAGTVFDPERAYHAMDIYLITSKYESFGLSVVESWSAGVPTVVSSADGFKEIANDDCAVICPVGSTSEFANAVLGLVNDKQKSSELCENARDKFMKNYSAEAFAKNIVNVYKEIKKSL